MKKNLRQVAVMKSVSLTNKRFLKLVERNYGSDFNFQSSEAEVKDRNLKKQVKIEDFFEFQEFLKPIHIRRKNRKYEQQAARRNYLRTLDKKSLFNSVNGQDISQSNNLLYSHRDPLLDSKKSCSNHKRCRSNTKQASELSVVSSAQKKAQSVKLLVSRFSKKDDTDYKFMMNQVIENEFSKLSRHKKNSLSLQGSTQNLYSQPNSINGHQRVKLAQTKMKRHKSNYSSIPKLNIGVSKEQKKLLHSFMRSPKFKKMVQKTKVIRSSKSKKGQGNNLVFFTQTKDKKSFHSKSPLKFKKIRLKSQKSIQKLNFPNIKLDKFQKDILKLRSSVSSRNRTPLNQRTKAFTARVQRPLDTDEGENSEKFQGQKEHYRSKYKNMESEAMDLNSNNIFR